MTPFWMQLNSQIIQLKTTKPKNETHEPLLAKGPNEPMQLKTQPSPQLTVNPPSLTN